MVNLKNTKAFTLIELLVVITIIGILATWATSVYTAQIQKARDTTRISDLESLKSWVEQSYQDVSAYPKWSTLESELIKYLQKIPTDSKYSQPCNDWGTALNAPACAYAYIVADDSNGIAFWEYELSTAFEALGNVTSKATNDGWSAGKWKVRFEIWIDTTNLLTDVDKETITTNNVKWVVVPDGSAVVTTADDTSLVIINGQP